MLSESWTPGRVNLIGEWIDFNGGTVLPGVLPLGVRIRREEMAGDADTIVSAQFADTGQAGLSEPASGHWSDYVRGALQAARHAGWIVGAQFVQLDSDIPAGSGLSSSAAVTVGTLKATAPDGASLTDIARMAHRVEHDFIGVPCGIMDQMAVAHGRPGEALALDTRSLAFKSINLPAGWAFAVLHSGVERRLADGRYAKRREACLAAASHLGRHWLCEADSFLGLPEGLLPIARHVVGEQRRSREAIDALRAGDAELFGRLMHESHDSLSRDFGVSTLEIDALVDDAMTLGASGARITGAGFGGCIVALLVDVRPQEWWQCLSVRHGNARWICQLGKGD